MERKGNIAFKFNYCNGKGDRGNWCVGYHDICTPEIIRYNIEKRKAAWCSNPDCACRMFYDASKNTNVCIEDYYKDFFADEEILCGECVLLEEWKATAQYDWTGSNPRPRKIRNADPFGLVVLTTIFPNEDGKDRKVFAVYIADEIFEGDDEECGFITATDYRLEMTRQEAEQLNFWDFHRNERTGKPVWGTGVFRYMYDYECARLLKCIMSIKRGTQDENMAKEMFHFYCQKHKIAPEEIL